MRKDTPGSCLLRLYTRKAGALLLGAAFALLALVPLRALFEAPSGEARILEVLDDLYRNQRRGMMNVSPTDGRFLRMLAAMSGSKRALEIGTSNGYSGIWIAAGLRETGGKLTTIEINAQRAALARENFKRAGVADIVKLIEADALKTVSELEGPFDFVFIDAWKEDYVRYLEMVYPKLAPGGVIAAHNVVSHAAQLEGYMKKLGEYPDLETVVALEKGAGIAVSYKKKPWPERR